MSQHNTPENNFIETLVIQDILLLNSEHKLYDLYNNQKIMIDLKSEDGLNLMIQEDLIIFEVTVKLNILDENIEDSLLLSSQAKFAGIYTYNKENLTGEDIKEFSQTFFQYAAVTHIMAFCREYFYSVLIKSGYPRVTLPLVNLLEDDAKKEASRILNNKEKK